MEHSISYFQEFVNVNRPKRENIMSTIVKYFAKTLAVVGLASVMFVGCSSTNQWRHSKYPTLETGDLASMPRAVRNDDGWFSSAPEPPAWLENPFMMKSSRFPYVAVGEANNPRASDRFNKNSAVNQARRELVAQLESEEHSSFESRDDSRGNLREKDRMVSKIRGVVNESHILSTHEVADSKLVYVLVAVDRGEIQELNDLQAEMQGSQVPEVAQNNDDFFNTDSGDF